MTSDQVTILMVAIACAVGVGVVGLALAWVIRRSSILWQLALVVAVAIGSVLVGVVAVSRLMFLSDHDRDVVSLVMAASGIVALLVARLITPMLAAYFLRDHAHTEEREGPAMRAYGRLVGWSASRSPPNASVLSGPRRAMTVKMTSTTPIPAVHGQAIRPTTARR